MRVPAALLLLPALPALLTACATPATAGGESPPGGLTGWRTEKGVFLSWSRTPPAVVTVWRGTAPGSLSALATLPPGQGGFWDTNATKGTGYFYALGDRKSHGAELELPGAPPPALILSGLVTTCSGLVPGAPFPADTQNYFYVSRHVHVQYFGYFLIKPFDPAPREARIVWRDPEGAVFSEYSHPTTPKKLDLHDGAVGQLVLAQAVGLREVIRQNGQKSLPTAPGMYSIETFVDGTPVAMTFFYIKEEAARKPVSPSGTQLAPAPAGVPRTNLPGAGLP